MSYVDAFHDKGKDEILVVERDSNGNREYLTYPAEYVLYYPDPNGTFRSIYGDALTQYRTRNGKAFSRQKKKLSHKKLFESDCNVTFRCLADHYMEVDTPPLHVAFFDIEVAWSSERGFAPPEDPFNPITTIGVHLNWLDRTICLAVKPEEMSQEEAEEIIGNIDDAYLMENEEEMLQMFFDLVDDADVLSGWNSESYDIPYIINRAIKLLGKGAIKKLCLWDQFPKKRKFESFGNEQETYDLVGRIHMDYLALYRKFTYHEMHSYSLDSISEHELGEKKVEYDGTLHQLYINDFGKFVSYNIQDVNLLRRIDDKLKYIDQANLLAHANTVTIPTTLGTVAQTDQAIINEAHRRGMIVPDKDNDKDNIPAAGAYVAIPIRGMHRWIGSMDLNSLYPSIFRACNMSLECIMAQVRHTRTIREICDVIVKTKGFAKKGIDPDDIEEILAFGKTLKDSPFAKYWEGKFACLEYDLVMDRDETEMLDLDFEDGNTLSLTGSEIHAMIFDNGMPWCFTSNATVLNFEKQGIVPSVLEKWYADRKLLQAKAKTWEQLMSGGLELPERLQA